MKAVGIELTEAEVKVLSLEHTGKAEKILHFHEGPIAPGPAGEWKDRAAAAVREAMAAARAPKGNVVVSIDSGEAILREISLPFKGEDQIRKTVRFEMESLIHNYTIEQLVVSHCKIGETEKGAILLAAAVPKEVIRRQLEVFQKAGVDPVAADLDVGALFNALRHAGAIDTDEPHLLIHGTTKFTKLVFIEQRQPRSIRTIRFSLPARGEGVHAAVSQEDEGRKIEKSDAGAPSAFIEILAREVSRFLLANAASSNPAHILISGDFEDGEVAKMLEAATQLPVRTFDLLGKADHPFGAGAAAVSPRVGVPLGLALKGTGADALGMDFRREEFAYRRRFDVIRTTALVTVELVIVFLAALALHFRFLRQDIKEAAAHVLDGHLKLYQSVAPEDEGIGDPMMAYPRMEELYKKYKESHGKGLPIEKTAREAWRDLFGALRAFHSKYASQALGEGSLRVLIEGIDIRQNTTSGNESFELVMRGVVRNLEYAQALKDEVRAAGPLFKDAEYVGRLDPHPDGFRFHLKAFQGKRSG